MASGRSTNGAGLAEIPHNRPWLLPQDIAEVPASLATGWLAPGPEVAALERDFAQLHGGGEACAVSSGSAALFIALKAVGVGPGDRVALPTYVCTAVLNAVTLCQADPVLIDIDAESFNIDPRALGGLTAAPRAVIAVHTYGAPADLTELARRAGSVVEDCCQSLGGIGSNGQMLGTAAAVAVYSFYATKIVTSGHGGMVYARAGKAAAESRDYILFDGRELWKPRFNFQLTDFQAALLRPQLARLGEIGARRRALAAAFRAALPSGYRVQTGLDGESAMPYRFVIRAPDAEARHRLRAHFTQAGIRTIVPLEQKELLHRQLGLPPEAFPVAERVAVTTLSLPLYPALTDGEATRIVDALGSAPTP